MLKKLNRRNGKWKFTTVGENKKGDLKMMNMLDFKIANPDFESWAMNASMDEIKCAIKYLEEEIEERELSKKEEGF